MKNTILLSAATLLLASATFVQAGDGIVPLDRGGFSVQRGGGNYYRPIPKVGADVNRTSRYNTVIYKPTQHFYTKDNVVSYRYTEDRQHGENSLGETYLGPRGGVFEPNMDQMVPAAGIRNYASVDRRPQPGVNMVNREPVSTKRRKASQPEAIGDRTSAQTRIASATR
jgi:hypothetical protein